MNDLLKVVGEPEAYLHRWLPCAATIGKTLHFQATTPHKDDVVVTPLYTESQLQAVYAQGVEDMRERAADLCSQLEDDYLAHRVFPEEYDMTQAAAACGSCANTIRALPTEGKQG